MWKFPPSTLFLIVLLPSEIARHWLFHIRERGYITGYLGRRSQEQILLSLAFGFHQPPSLYWCLGGAWGAWLTIDSLLIAFNTALTWKLLIAYLMSVWMNCFTWSPSLKPLRMSQASPLETFVILLERRPWICFLAFQPVQQRSGCCTRWWRSEKSSCSLMFLQFCEVWAFFSAVQKGGSRRLGFHSCYGRAIKKCYFCSLKMCIYSVNQLFEQTITHCP